MKRENCLNELLLWHAWVTALTSVSIKIFRDFSGLGDKTCCSFPILVFILVSIILC